MQNQNDQIIHWRILENGTCKTVFKEGGGAYIKYFSVSDNSLHFEYGNVFSYFKSKFKFV